MTNILLSAEKQYRKLRTGAVSYSPELLKVGLKQRFQRKLLHYKTNRFQNLEWINQTVAYLQINNSVSTSYQIALSSLKDAKRKYLNLKKNHQKLRDKYANSIYQSKVKLLCYKEKIKMKQRRLKSVFGKKQMKSISSVKYTINGTIIRSLTKLEMEEVIMNENSSHF